MTPIEIPNPPMQRDAGAASRMKYWNDGLMPRTPATQYATL